MASAQLSLNILIVGAGLGGLSVSIACALAGHQVTVLEGSKHLAEIGAGLQITPNASRLLKEWGLEQEVEKAAAEPTVLSVHRYADGSILARDENFNRKMRRRYGAPFLDLHRADLQRLLYARAVDLGVKIRLGARVSQVNTEIAEVTLESGQNLVGDLVVGADGLWSRCRESFLGIKDSPLPTGDLAYRIVLDLDKIQEPDLKAWISNPEVHFWIGPQAHAVGYSLRGGTMYNIVLLCPDNLPDNISKQAASVEEMRQLFIGWDPILTRFLDHVNSVDKWKLMHREEVKSWINGRGNFVLVGDSCHPMLPYLAQGANSSIEDGGVLGRLLSYVASKAQLPAAIRMYEKLRKHRSEAIVRQTFQQRLDFHMPDGPEQEARDKVFLSQLGKEVSGKFPSRWTCAEVQPWLYGYDASKEADAAVQAHPLTAMSNGSLLPSASVSIG